MSNNRGSDSATPPAVAAFYAMPVEELRAEQAPRVDTTGRGSRGRGMIDYFTDDELDAVPVRVGIRDSRGVPMVKERHRQWSELIDYNAVWFQDQLLFPKPDPSTFTRAQGRCPECDFRIENGFMIGVHSGSLLVTPEGISFAGCRTCEERRKENKVSNHDH